MLQIARFFPIFFLCLTPGILNLAAQDEPAMPMHAKYEDGANYRWLSKPVLESGCSTIWKASKPGACAAEEK
jgi:hypothetical protein